MSAEVLIKPESKTISKSVVVFTFLLGIFMGALDHGIVGPALSSILLTFNIGPSWGVWSLTIYTLFFAVSIPVMGKLSDRVGRKKTFMSGIAVFALGSVLAAVAPNFIVFLIGRAVQAVGTGGIFPITAAQIAVSYPPEKRGKALGMIGVFFGLGTILGPVLGGIIISTLQWQWIFWINVPIAAVILLMMTRYRAEQKVVKRPIDFTGIALLTVIIFTIMLGVTERNGWFLLAALILAPVLIAVERRQADPVMNMDYFKRSKTVALLTASLISGFVMATATHLLPLYAESLLGIARGSSGFTVTPMAVSSMTASLAAGFLVDRIGAGKVILLGFAVAIAGSVSLALLSESLVLFLAVLFVMGFGIGIIIGAPLNVLMLQAVDPKETGAAVGYLSLFRSLGSTIGPAVAGMLLSASGQGFMTLYIISAAVSAAGIAMLWRFALKKKQV